MPNDLVLAIHVSILEHLMCLRIFSCSNTSPQNTIWAQYSVEILINYKHAAEINNVFNKFVEMFLQCLYFCQGSMKVSVLSFAPELSK